MLLDTLERLHKTLTDNPAIEVKKWEIGPPATEAQVMDFLQRVSEAWKQVPKTFLDVYRQVNGFHFEWKHEANVYGSLHLMPLDQIFTYAQHFEFSQHIVDAPHLYLIEFFMPEVVICLLADPEGGAKDSMIAIYFKDEDGEDTGLTLAKYLDRMLKAWGTDDGLRLILDPDHLEDEYDIHAKRWPFKDIEAYVQAIDPERRIKAALKDSPTDWFSELRDLGYELFSVNNLYDFREWTDLKRGEIKLLQLKCNDATSESTDIFTTFPSLEVLRLSGSSDPKTYVRSYLNPKTNLSGLSNCAKLNELSLEYEDLTPAIPQLDGYTFPSVKILQLGGEGKNWNWRFLAKFPALQELKLLNRLLSMGDAIKGMKGKHQTFSR